MQKKLIALAVAGLATTAAFAQSNVTIYGLVDYGYTYRWDARSNASATIGAPVVSTPNSSGQLNGGQSASNRIGFKGTEDLGNGLKAVFLLEQGFLLDTGLQQTAASAFTRQAYAGLSGNFGTVVGGRLYTPHYSFVSGLDPFGAGTVGKYNNVFKPNGRLNSLTAVQPGLGSVGTLTALMDPTRVDNTVAYISPSFGGFTVTAAFSNNATGQESANSNAANNTFYAILGQYNNGPIVAGINYHYIAASTGLGSSMFGVGNVQNVDVGGSWKFNVAKVMFLYSWNQLDYVSPGIGDPGVNNYILGVTAPFGKWSGKASYQYSDGNTAAGGGAQQVAIGFDYNFSTRTKIYSAYSFINNDDQRLAATGDAANSGAYAAGNGFASAGVFQQGVQIGLQHKF